jgi:cyclopropane fatty-acyl-phospholipid synthase-like methyltransferase
MTQQNAPTQAPQKPYSASCDENKQVILEHIAPLLTQAQSVLEIGSGTGQHAVYFAQHLPHLTWQTSDLIAHHDGIKQWLTHANLPNVKPPLILDVTQTPWPSGRFDAVYSANSFHIMDHHAVEQFFKHLPLALNPKAKVLIYGPFNQHNQFTSPSNAAFDAWLKERNPHSGIKDFEWCDQLAQHADLTLCQDHAMPQNNRLLVWQTA